jgi:hypothetical protein
MNVKATKTVQVTERAPGGHLRQVNKTLEFEIDYDGLMRLLARHATANHTGKTMLLSGIIKGKIKP